MPPVKSKQNPTPKTASSPNHGWRSGEYATKPIVVPGHFLAGLYHRRARGEATAFAGSRGEVHHLLAEWRRGGKEALSSAASERKRTGGVYLGMCFFEGTLRSLIQKESQKKTSFWESRCFDTGLGELHTAGIRRSNWQSWGAAWTAHRASRNSNSGAKLVRLRLPNDGRHSNRRAWSEAVALRVLYLTRIWKFHLRVPETWRPTQFSSMSSWGTAHVFVSQVKSLRRR